MKEGGRKPDVFPMYYYFIVFIFVSSKEKSTRLYFDYYFDKTFSIKLGKSNYQRHFSNLI
jgi:hypothetical protein